MSDPFHGESAGKAPLRERIDAFRRQAIEPPKAAPGEVTPLAQGMRGAAELATAVLVGAGIGLGLDHITGLRPFFSILFFLLGVAAGVVNLVRAASPKRQK